MCPPASALVRERWSGRFSPSLGVVPLSAGNSSFLAVLLLYFVCSFEYDSAFLPPATSVAGPDPGWIKKNLYPDPGFGSGMNNLDHISESLETFWVKKNTGT